MMTVCRVKGVVDGATLRAELEAALGPPASDRWWPVFDPNEAVVTYDDRLFTGLVISRILGVHTSQAAVEARAAAVPISLESLAASDPVAAKIISVLKIGGLLKEK